ncbi:MAG: hypothetical protein ACOYXM_06280 [Actinomycetota bacterium]
MKRTRAFAVALAVLLALTACGKQEKDSEEVREFIDASDTLARRFVYTEETKERTIVVQGLVEDDFRYKTKVVQDGSDVLEAVVSDDSVAVRFLDPELIGAWMDEEVASEVDQATDLEGIGVLDALRARRWVLDAGGAPPVARSAEQLETQGDDPLLDALTALSYVRDIAEAKDLTPMIKYNPEAISPTYRADEDPFPVPEEGSGVERYDVYQPKLPSAAQATSGSQAVLPSALNFRKLAVYVKDGRVIQVSEHIGLTPRLLDDLGSYMLQLIDTTAPENIRRDFRARVDRLRGEELGEFLLQGLNAIIEIAGDEPIRFRSMTLELRDLGADDIDVELPGETIRGSLAVLKNLGRKPSIDDDAPATGTGPGTGSGTTTTLVDG